MRNIQKQMEPMRQDTGMGDGQKAIIITGDEDLKNMLKYCLGSYGMQVMFCQGGAEALAIKTIDPFDCIILDCDTPGMGGIDHIRRLREQFVSAVIIGLCREDRGVPYLQAGMNDFLQKPIIPYNLAMMLDGGDILS